MQKQLRYQAVNTNRLETVLRNEVGLTRREIRRAKFTENGICVNGVRSRIDAMIHPGDRIDIIIEETGTSGHLISWERTPDIVYEDEDLLLVNKPAGLVVHPSHGHYQDSLANMLMYYFRSKGIEQKIRPVGRLDRDTSGIVVFAKSQAAAGRLIRQKETGVFFKEYTAITEGILSEKSGVIRQRIKNEPGELMKMCVASDGKEACTRYQVEREGWDCSVVRVWPKTGRTHQIRVHMAWLGHPLLGDLLYGSADTRIKRASLHAGTVVLRQPFTEKSLVITAAWPEDMQKIIEKTGGIRHDD